MDVRPSRIAGLLSLLMFVLGVVTLLWDITLTGWIFALLAPISIGVCVRHASVIVDATHEPEKDFPRWMYYLLWLIFGVISYGIYVVMLGGVFTAAELTRWSAWFVATYTAGLLTPFKFNSLNPSQRNSNDV